MKRLVWFLLFGITVFYFGRTCGVSETVVVGIAFHAFEWLFVRVVPIFLLVAIVGFFLTRERSRE